MVTEMSARPFRQPITIPTRSPQGDTGSTEDVDTIPARILELLQRNDILSATDLQSINAYAAQCMSEEAHLDVEIHHLTSRIGDLQKKLGLAKGKRQEVERRRTEIEKLRAPLRRLPADVLSEVFLWYRDVAEGDNSGLSKIRPGYSPLVPGWVCKYWRTVSLCTPRLWSDLRLSIPWDIIRDGTATATFGPIVREWYGRAGSTPLSLSLNLTLGKLSLSRTGGDRSTKQFLHDVIVPYMGRMRQFRLSGREVLLLLISLQPGRFQKLESVILWCNDYGSGPERLDSPDVLSAFRDSLSLHRFSLNTFPRLLRVANYILPWSQLTHLVLPEPNNPTHFLNILQQCSTRLEHGFFGLDETDFYSFSDDMPPITLSKLHELTIVFSGPVDPTAFKHLHFPSLYTLRIASEQRFDEEQFWDDSSSDLYAKLGGIRRLSLAKSWRMPEGEFQLLLQTLPSLIELDLDLLVDYRDLHSALSSLTLPDLKALCVSFTNSAGLVNFMESCLSDIDWISALQKIQFSLDNSYDEYEDSFEERDIAKLQEAVSGVRSMMGGDFDIQIFEPGNTTHWLSRLPAEDGHWAEGVASIPEVV